MATVTIYSSAADGVIQSTSAVYLTMRSGSTLVAVDAGTVGFIGQQQYAGLNYEGYETFLDFDTSVIPDAAVITTAVLSIHNDFSDQTSSAFVVQARLRDWGATLTTADWVAGASLAALTLLAQKSWSGISNGTRVTITEEGTALKDNITKTGVTRMLLHSDRFSAGTTPALTSGEYMQVPLLETAGTTNDPTLVITYPAAQTHQMMV